MKFVKIILILLFVMALIAGAVWQFWLKSQVDFAKVATAFSAKQVCSCRFVAERELESCLGDFTVDVSQINFSVTSTHVDDNGRTEIEQSVTASVLGGLIKDEARFEPELGCSLVKP